jgi:subtilisin family serine protease
MDASTTSPASTKEAITVGATDITDSRAFYSNYGPVVDVFAPGSNVTSTWPDGKTQVLSGTSMATPNVAGLVAYFLSSPNPPTTPAAMSEYIKQVSTKGVVTGMRE